MIKDLLSMASEELLQRFTAALQPAIHDSGLHLHERECAKSSGPASSPNLINWSGSPG